MVSESSVEKSVLHDWAEEQCRPIDVVASWEVLCETYRILEFTDPLSDTVRLEEFKWIVKEMNKFLTRMRQKLFSCRNMDAAMEVLMNSLIPGGTVNIDGRRNLAYQKLRQRWVMQMISMLNQMGQQMETEIQKGGPDGWAD